MIKREDVEIVRRSSMSTNNGRPFIVPPVVYVNDEFKEGDEVRIYMMIVKNGKVVRWEDFNG